VWLWEVSTGRHLRTFQGALKGHAQGVTSVSLSADGCWLVSGSADKSAKLWEVSTGRRLRSFWSLLPLQSHKDVVTAVSLSADGCWLFSGSRDGTVRLWEVSTGKCLYVFRGDIGEVTSVSLSTDGRWLVAGGSKKTMHVWELDWEVKAYNLVDWDKGARPFLETFLHCHTPYAGVLAREGNPTEQEIQQALIRQGTPAWNEEDFQELIRQLRSVGYGWLRPEGVRRRLDLMAKRWQGPPPLRRKRRSLQSIKRRQKRK